MRRFLFILLMMFGICTLCFINVPQVQAATTIQQKPDSGGSYTYYTYADSYGVEWVAIPQYQLSMNQNYWVFFPAALASYNIQGVWEWGSDGNLYFVPSYSLTAYQEQVTTITTSTIMEATASDATVSSTVASTTFDTSQISGSASYQSQ